MLQWRSRFQPLSKHSLEPIRCRLHRLGACMRRREFLGALGGAAAWPLAARAQQPIPKIGILASFSSTSNPRFIAAFRQGLREAGYIEGQNVAIEFRWAENQYDRLP